MMVNSKSIPALRFKGFDERWVQKRLGEVCEKIQDGNYGAEYPTADEFVPNGIPFLTSKALGGDGFIKEDKIDFIPIEKHNKLKKAQLKLHDVLFTNRGSNVGSIGFVDERIAHGNIGPQLTLLRCDLITISSKFLYQIMLSHPLRTQIRSQDSGSAMNFFGIGVTSKFKLTIPSLPEQQKIASFLSAIDEKMQQLTRKKELLEEYKKGVMQQLFSGKLRFKDENGKAYPKWEEKRLGDVLDYIQPTKYLVASTEYDDSYKTPVLTAGKTFILGYTNETNDIYSENFPVILFDDFTTATQFVDFPFKAKSSAMKILVAKKGENIGYIYEAMRLINFEIGGHGRHWISQFALLSIPYPCIEEQQKIANYLSCIDNKIENVANQIKQTQNYKKGLLQQMFV